MPRWLYTLALRIILPLALLVFLWRGWRNRAYRGSLRERLGLGLRRREDRPIWLHAASVGEVQALAGLLRSLAQMTEPQPLLLTAGTPTGLARARFLYADLLLPRADGGALLTLQAAPWDLPGAASRFLRASDPRAAVFVETELWPNLIAAARREEVPLVLVSARVSERSTRRYLRFARSLLRHSVRAFSSIGAQSAVDRERFVRLGADAERVTVIGNLKFDFPLPPDLLDRGDALRDGWAAERPLWVAGSTHAVEEGICIEAQRQLLAQANVQGRARPLLLLAPRRPERFAEVGTWLKTQRLATARLSQARLLDAAAVDVLLLDAMGELLDWYAAADVAFVGGTLVPLGGHNLLEPAALGKPVLAGPHTANSPQAAALLAASGALGTVRDAYELAQALDELLTDEILARVRGDSAAAVVDANRGAADRARAMIAALPTGR